MLDGVSTPAYTERSDKGIAIVIGQKRVLAIVPARGGSKGLPGKNVKPLLGKPLIGWTLEAAKASQYLDRIHVSTDDAEIAAVAAKFGCAPDFMRPEALAQDKSSVIDAVLHDIDRIGEHWDFLVLLQPTSPLRMTSDIDAVIETCVTRDAPSVVTVSPLNKPGNFLGTVSSDGQLTRGVNVAGEIMMLNGAVYVIRMEAFLKARAFIVEGTLAHPIPYERAWDIDYLFDFIACEALMPHLIGDETALTAVRR